jgi:hypothetical protein
MIEERESAARYSLVLEARRANCAEGRTSGSLLSRLHRTIARSLAAGFRQFLADCACIVETVDFAAARSLTSPSHVRDGGRSET